MAMPTSPVSQLLPRLLRQWVLIKLITSERKSFAKRQATPIGNFTAEVPRARSAGAAQTTEAGHIDTAAWDASTTGVRNHVRLVSKMFLCSTMPAVVVQGYSVTLAIVCSAGPPT